MIAAIVILHYPDRRALERLQESLGGQVHALLVIDNTPGSSLPKPDFLGDMVSYIPLGENRGIAEAQNIGINWSIERHYSHILLLDQDSAASVDMVSKLLAAEEELLRKGKKVAAMAPQIIDERSGARPVAVRYRLLSILSAKKVYRNINVSRPEETDNFIASGSLISVDALKAVGGMRSDLFIEYVDTEWALRARNAGFKAFCVPSATLTHSFGDGAKNILGKSIYLYSDLRYCYKLRNSVFLLRVRTMGWRWRAYNLTRIPYHLLVYSLFSVHRRKTFLMLLQAMRDGWRGRLGPYSIPGESARRLRPPSDDSGAYAQRVSR